MIILPFVLRQELFISLIVTHTSNSLKRHIWIIFLAPASCDHDTSLMVRKSELLVGGTRSICEIIWKNFIF